MRGGRFRNQRRRGNRTLYFKKGDWNVVSDVTGLVFKRSECQLTWDNLLVEKSQFDPKQPQLDLRGKPDHPSVPLARPDSDPMFAVPPTAEEL